MATWRRALPVALLALPWVASCGGGTVAIATLFKHGGGSAASSTRVIADVAVDDPSKTSPASVSFRLIDPQGRPMSVELLVVHPGGQTETALLTGDTNLTDLATSGTGVVFVRQWDFAAQLATGTSLATGMRLMVRERGGVDGVESNAFAAGNDAPLVSIVDAPTGEVVGPVAVTLAVSDSSSDLVDVLVEYSDRADPTTWKPATPFGTDLQRLATTPTGTSALFLWDVGTDEPHREFTARLRFTPTDRFDAGAAVETSDLLIDNNAAPTLIVDGSGFFADPDTRRGIPVRYQIVDEEGDPLRVVFQWARDSKSFPVLPGDPASIDAILASPDLRHQYQIATERSIAHRGRVAPVSSVAARLPGLATASTGLLSEFLVGRSLELLPVPAPPGGRAAGWSANPLVAPAAVLRVVAAPDALVLDRPSPGNWRLREVDLATGAVVRAIASGPDGDPSALAWSIDRQSVLIAADAGGVWSLFEIHVADGTRAPFFVATGSVPPGTVRGLAATGRDTALVTVADSLLALDRSQPALPTARVLLAGLAGPWGIAIDPRHVSRLYLAEATWVDPATSTVEGRVSSVDLATLTRVDVVARGLKLSRPQAIALERGGARLLAVVDANQADGTMELRAVDLGNGGGGAAFQIVAGLPMDVTGLATGDDDARLLCLPGQNDLAAGGGVQQVRTITAADFTTCEVTVDAPFAPALDARQEWRIADLSSPLPAGARVRNDTFVWDSSDLPSGGDVVLRGVACDTESGLATDTGVPRSVHAGLDVLPIHIGGAASTTGVAGLAAADLDGDGDLDVVSANAGADSATIFFQDANHQFPQAPDVTVKGVPILAKMTQPVAVIAADLDRDGDADIATANHGSNNLIYAKQGPPGSFSVQLVSLGGITGPTDLVAADLNGDQRIDLACSNDGSNNLAIYFQSSLGLFPTSPSALLGNATTLGASGIDAGDVDGDGDVDLVASFRTSNNLGIFLQTGAGTFPAAPSQLLGGPGRTDGAEAVRLADVDRDGRLDIVSANRAGNCVTVFLQAAGGGFSMTPTYTLASSGGPVSPSHVAVGDVNGDGGVDIVATSATDSLVVFLRDPITGSFASEPLFVHGAGSVLGPVFTLVDDLDGDGQIDLASANQTGNDVTLFFQLGGRSFAGQSPDVVLGSATETPDVHAVAVGDLDGDGDLDLASADSGDGSVSIYLQLAPAVFATRANERLGGDAATAGAAAIAAADLSGDGRVDLVTANRGAKTLTVYLQRPDGTFPTTADLVLGGGVLVDPAAVTLADLDGDGDVDIACADVGSNRVALFHRAPDGSFPSAPDALLGSSATTKGVAMVLAADIDGDGRIDLVTANTAGNNLAIFFQQPSGTFHALPDLTLGATGQTDGPVVVAAADLDGDGNLDLACANQTGNSVAIFFATGPGAFTAAPSLVLTHASLQGPTSLCLEDVDRDGSCDVVCGCSTSDRIVLFFQGNPGAFPTAEVIGSSSYTASPLSLTVVDLDGDGDEDLVSAEPDLDNIPIFFGAH